MKELVRGDGREQDFEISSAAVSYEEQGNPIYPPAARKLREKGVPYGDHRAHRITPSEATEADLIIIMDRSNERLIRNIIRPEDMQKVHFMMEYADMIGHADKMEHTDAVSYDPAENWSPRRAFQVRDVADPWYTGNFEQAWQDIYDGCHGLLISLSQN